MNNLFEKLPLQTKLMLIGLIPYIFLVYLTIQVYNDKTQKLQLFTVYKNYIEESATITQLIAALQRERKFSFDYAMTKGHREHLILQRPHTDALLHKLETKNNPALAGFQKYTKLQNLAEIRGKIDRHEISPNEVMHYYSNTVFRMNTLNTIPPAQTPYLTPVYKDLMTQKVLSEMITYIGLIRSNIYNVLHTREYMVETLVGTKGAYDVYKSYEEELFAKARPEVLVNYNTLKDTTAVKPMMVYIDQVFTRFTFDDSYNAAEWWAVSNKGADELRAFQTVLQNKLRADITSLYEKELQSRENTLLFLIFALVAVMFFVAYIMYLISQSLKRLRMAAERIADGEISVEIRSETNDVIGKLADSVSKIDQTNQTLAYAALEIGKGNFDIAVNPRGERDILGSAIMKMKSNLQSYSEKMELLVSKRTEELARSNDDLQQFAHVASHDLKEPLRKIAMFSNIIGNDHEQELSEKSKAYLHKIENASQRMSAMIEGVLSYSIININQPIFELVNLTLILEGVENDLELAIVQKDAKIIYNELPAVPGISLLLHQLFYNLINNALKFSKPEVSPIITISHKYSDGSPLKLGAVASAEKYVEIIVSDNGIGINPAYAEQVFTIFSRLHAKDKYEGTGLGLALCRKIVQRHGGFIHADGEEGKGSSFHVFLPIK
ncbi:MAG TPA: ATP-binding protein [Flavobacterium sp.]|jgi:signal transduction histidine kinase